ncbi:MAG: cytochrome P450 [Sphingomonadales bacterium]|nr:cytochrome P450 [Sphingomonadales bacterium]
MASQAREKFQIPDHVPPELVINVGITESPEFLADPYAFFRKLAETHPPIFYSVGSHGGSWHFLKHADAFRMLRDAEYFSNEGGTPFPRDPADPFKFIPIEIDPPEHRKYRAILDPVFSPQGIQRLEGTIRQLANDLIDEVVDKKECEFTTAYGRPLPVSIFLDLMGLPQSMRDTFVNWAMGLLHSTTYEGMASAFAEIVAYLKQAIADKKVNRDDRVISSIVHGEIDGRPLDDKEIFGFVCFLFIAGLDTVFATMNNMWLWLAENPDRRHEIIARMTDRPGDMNAITEELLRMWAVTFSGRTLRKDLELRGVQMKAGDKVMSVLPSANYDAEVWPNPLDVDFDRVRKPILSFAGGVHSCMGAHLARLEIRIGLEEWLKRIPDFSVKPGTEIEYRPGGVVGPEFLPLEW